jgi:type IV pilus assembly protein PilB
LGQALSEQYGVPFLEIVPESINPQIVRLLPEDLARSCKVVPIGINQRQLQLAMVAPDDMDAIGEAELITGYQVLSVVSLQNYIDAALDRGFDDPHQSPLARGQVRAHGVDEVRDAKAAQLLLDARPRRRLRR